MSNSTIANAAAPRRVITPDAVQAHATSFVTDSLSYVRENWLEAAIAIGVGTGIVLGLFALRRLGRGLCERVDRKAGPGWGWVFGRAVARTGTVFIVMLAAKLVAHYADPPPAVSSTITFLFTIAAVFQGALWARELVLGAVERKTASQDHATLGSAFGLIRLLVTFTLFAIAIVVVLSNLGVNVTGLVAGLGVGGIAIGLAAQGIFADLFAALAIIFDRPFRIGDAIAYDKSSGTVEGIGLKSTRVRGGNGELRVIANRKLLDQEILNNTERARRRNKFTLGLVYQTPLETCRRLPQILREIVEAERLQFVRAGFINFGESTLDFELEFDCPHPDLAHAQEARNAVGLAILERFNAEGIEFAYPTQTSVSSEPVAALGSSLPASTETQPAPPAA